MSEGAKFIPDEASFSKLKDKVVILTGGANGIGAATVHLLHRAGAHVVFGDLATSAGEALASSLSDRVTFVQTDVTKYGDNIKLFKTAFQKHGRVDHAVACAGIIESGRWFDPELTLESVEAPASNKTLEVNMFGTVYFVRIAVVYLREGKMEGDDKSLTLISSAAGFRESPGLPIYQCTKHGVMGLMRALRKVIYPQHGIRINTVCPGMTDTQMTTAWIEQFRTTGQAINTAEDIARVILDLEVAEDRNGQAVYVEGGRGWEIEQNLEKTMPMWLGEEPTKRLRGALQQVKDGRGWNIR